MAIRGIDGTRIGGLGGTPDPNQHTVKTGETLDGIAQKLGVSAQELLKHNPGVKDPESIKPGQVLNLPGVQRSAPQLTRPKDSIEKTTAPTVFDAPGWKTLARSSFGDMNALPVKLASSEFQKNEQGHLVVKNEHLTGLFKAFLERSPTGGTNLNFGRIVPGEASNPKDAGDPKSLDLSRLSPATAQFYQEFLGRQLGDPAQAGAAGKDAESRIWFAQRQDAGPDRFGEAHDSKTKGMSQGASTPRLDPGEARASKVEAQLFDVFRPAAQSPSTGEARASKVETQQFDAFHPASRNHGPTEARASSPKLDPGEARWSKVETPAQDMFRPAVSQSGSPGDARAIKIEVRASQPEPQSFFDVSRPPSQSQSPADAPAYKYMPADVPAVRLSPEQFEINKEGNLVIKSEQLSNLLNAALGAANRGDLVGFGLTAGRED